MLRRLADARLRADLTHAVESRDRYHSLARTLASRCRALRQALHTQAQLTERWRLIAQGQASELSVLRQQIKEYQK